MTSIGIHNSYTNPDSYTFKQKEVPTDKLNYLGFVVLELSNLLMYETSDKLQPYFREKNN